MKIFVAYGYGSRDKWVEDLVFPIIEAFGAEVAVGKEVPGQIISEAVRNAIRSSDALIAFVTRRDKMGDRYWTTHRWVTDELTCAIDHKLSAIEVRETEVDDQGGMQGDRQRIIYDEKERDKCLVELVKAIGAWCRSTTARLKLMPESFVSELRPILQVPGIHCSYKFLLGSRLSADFPARILPLAGGLAVDVENIPQGQVFVQVQVQGRDTTWTSDFEPIDLLSVHMKRG